MFEIKNEKEVTLGAKIRVVGVGGGGCNAVNTMIRSGLSGVEYIVANTDAQALAANLAPTKIQLGSDITKGLGAGANPEVGRKAALDEYEQLSQVLEGADMVFITAGMGGGTGTGAAPVVAKLAKELGALTVGVVTKPFLFEGKKRFRQAEAGIQTLEESVDSLITIPNQRLLYLAGESLSLVDTFKRADEVLLNAVRGISDLINTTGHINADFADVKTVMANKGLSLMGTGLCAGPDRAIKAATEAISSPLLEDITIDGATGIIINITGNSSLTMHETNEAVTLIMEAADDDAEIIFGSVIDDTLEDAIKVTVIATGLGGQERVMARPTQAPVQHTRTVEAETNYRAPAAAPQREMVAEAPKATPAAEPMRREVYAQETVTETPAHEMARGNDYSREQEEAPRSSTLLESIKNAASRYEASRTATSPTPSMNRPASAYAHPERKEGQDGAGNRDGVINSRAKSIAEKLGFINFDEEELDTPSFLRREEAAPKKERQDGPNRPLDI